MSRRKADYPIKRSMNLYYKPDRTTKPATAALVGTDKSGLMVAAAGLSVTEDRKKSISFSTPYTTTVQAIVSLEENNYKTLDGLVGKTVAVQNGTTGEKLIKAYNEGKAKDKQINIQPVPAVTNAFLELKQLGVDALVIDSLVAKSLVVKG